MKLSDIYKLGRKRGYQAAQRDHLKDSIEGLEWQDVDYLLALADLGDDYAFGLACRLASVLASPCFVSAPRSIRSSS